MSSLSFIMDMNDEEPTSGDSHKRNDPSFTGGRDHSSASTSAGPSASQNERVITPATASSTSTSSSTTKATTTSSGSKRRGASGRHSKSSAAATTAKTTSATATEASSSSSSFSLTSAAQAAASSASSSRPAPKSNTSITSTRTSTRNEEMSQSSGYGGGAGPMGGSTGSSGGGGSNPPNRPLGNPPEVPVKLTPITGRVSRAKKGVPVHTCDICRPPKTFTRAEHLRRHQLSHQTPGFPCTYPGCDRAFHRADLLNRHLLRHEQEGDRTSSRGTSRRESTTSIDYMSSGSQAMAGPSSSRGAMATQSPDMQSGGGFGGNYQGSGGATPMSPPQQMPGRRESYQSTSSGQGQGNNNSYILSPTIPLISNQPPSLESSPTTGNQYGLEYQQPRTSSPFPLYLVTQGLQHHLPSLTIPDSNPPGLLAPNEVSPWTSDSNFSTPSDVSQRRSWAAPRGGYSSPISDWAGQGHHLVPPYHHPAVSQDLQSPGGGIEGLTTAPPYFVDSFSPSFSSPMDVSMFQDDNTGFLESYAPQQHHHQQHNPHHHHHQQHPYSSVRSPTPPTMPSSLQSAETLVTLAPADASMVAGRYFNTHKDQAALTNLGGGTIGNSPGIGLGLSSLSSAAFLTAHQLPRPVRNAIDDFLDVYWKRFDAFFPLVHRRALQNAPNDVLRCAMAAVGTQYLDGKEDRVKGNLLHEFAWQEIRRAPQWNVQIMQAILLCEFYSRFRGKKATIRPSQHFQSLYSRDQLFSLVSSSPVSQWHPYSTFRTSQVVNNPSLSQPQPLTTTNSQQHQQLQQPQSPLDTTETTHTTTSTTTSTNPIDTATATATSTTDNPTSATTIEQRWTEWIEAEARRRLLAACFVLDVHTSVYHEQPLMQPFTNPYPPIPLTTVSKDLWAAQSPESWDAAITAINTSAGPSEPQVLSEDIITRNHIANAMPLDRMVFLAAEALRLPKRTNPNTLDHLTSATPSSSTSATVTDRIETLFPQSPVAHTYLALHFTPLHDLLAVSGDSWLFTQKVLGPQSFQQHQKHLKAWCASPAAVAAARFAARALLGFLDVAKARGGDLSSPSSSSSVAATPVNTASAGEEASSSSTARRYAWNRSDISDYWALYVCALICWALSHQASRGNTAAASAKSSAVATSSSLASTAAATMGNNNVNQQEAEALGWLRMLARMRNSDNTSAVIRAGRREMVGVVATVRRRLEGEAAGAGKSRLLVDALGVLKKLEEGVNWKWF